MLHRELKRLLIAEDMAQAFTLSRVDIRIASALPTSRISSASVRSETRIAKSHAGDH
jgi:hypothetical protein